VLIVFFAVRYYNYKKFTSKPQWIVAKVVSQYKKKNYWVLKLKNFDIEFYTTTRDDLKDILNKKVEVGVVTKKISFWEYLTKFYAPTFKLGLLEDLVYKNFIISQHKSRKVANIYNALFFGDSLYYDTRVQLSTLGISHLFALSGFHLAIISGILYFILSPIYRFFPPYRNKNIELGVLILGILFLYLYFVGFPPSLVRSYLMEFIVFIFAFYLKDIFSFRLLFLAVVIAIVLFPRFVINVGFFLSVMGVFFIFLYFKFFRPSFVSGIVLPFYLYFVMFFVVHHFFGNFNYYQLLSPFVSLIFTIFYPLEIVLHLFGIGGVFDNLILEYLKLGDSFVQIYIPFWLFMGYLMFVFFLSFYPTTYNNSKS
jgi:competence protein ComEC